MSYTHTVEARIQNEARVTGRQLVFNEALVGVIRIRDIWVKNFFRDMGHLRNKLIWDISKFTWQPGGQSDIV